MASYPSLSQLKTEIGTGLDVADDVLTGKLLAAIRAIEGPTGLNRWIEPHIATRYYREDDILADGRLWLGEDLLTVTTLTNGDTAAILPANYWLLPRNQTPYWYIELKSGYSWDFDTDGEVALDGVWGWHTRYADAWINSGGEVENATGLTATGTSVTTSEPSLIEPAQVVRIDSEYMRVTEVVGTGSATVTVKRGINGSTAATHAKDTPIYLWEPREDVTENVVRLAAFFFKLKDAQVWDVTAAPELGVITLPKGTPADVKLWLVNNRRLA